MNYTVNPRKFLGVTVLPSEIAEKYLKISSASQLKVLIASFSVSGGVFDCGKISSLTGIDEAEVGDILSYWAQEGFFIDSEKLPEVPIKSEIQAREETRQPENTQAVREQTKIVAEKADNTPKAIPSNNPSRLTYNEICTRIAESESIRFLLNEAQLKLGRTVGTGDQSSLILLHDYYGLPAEVILCICEYASTKGKSTNMNYIYKIGVDWSQREIDTLDAADEELKSIEKTNGVWKEFCIAAKIAYTTPTVTQEKYMSQWAGNWKFSIPVICAAFEEMKAHTDKISYSYMHKVLSSWHLKGITNLSQVESEKERFLKEQEEKALKQAAGKKKKAEPKSEAKPDPTASYDIKRAQERALTAVPELKKRSKR